MDLIEKLQSNPLLRVTGWKNVELVYLHQNLDCDGASSSLVVGEGGQGGEEGVSATVLDYVRGLTNTHNIHCVDIAPLPKNSFLDMEIKTRETYGYTGPLEFYQTDIVDYKTCYKYRNIILINSLEHTGFKPGENTPYRDDYFMCVIDKLCELCFRAGQIILTIPYDPFSENDTYFTGGRNFSENTIRKIEKHISILDFYFEEELTFINVNLTSNFFLISEENLKIKRANNDRRDEYLKAIIIKKKNSQ